MPLQPRCHTLRPDRASGWLVFFQLVKEAGRTGYFLVVGPGGERTKAAREGAVAAGQQAVRYFKDTPSGAPAATLVEGAMTLLIHEATALGLPLEFGCGVIEERRLWLAARGRVRLVPVSPKLGRPLGSEEPMEIPLSSQVRMFFGRFPEEFEDPRIAAEVGQRIEQGQLHEGGLIFSFAEVEALRDVAPPLRATRAVTPLPAARVESTSRLELVEAPPEWEPVPFPAPTPVEPEPAPEPLVKPADAENTEVPAEDPLAPEENFVVDEPPPRHAAPRSGVLPVPTEETEPDPEAADESGEEPQEDLFTSWRREFETSDPILADEENAIEAEEPSPDPELEPVGAGDPAFADEPVWEADAEPEDEPEPVGASATTEPYLSSPRPGHPVARSTWTEAETVVGEKESGPAPLAGGAPYAPDETRGIGFWLAVAAAVGAVALLGAYLFVLRPGVRDGGPAPEAAETATEPPLPLSPALAWSAKFDNAVSSSPAVVGETLVFGCRDGKVYALRASDGERAWAFGAADGFGSSPLAAGDLVVIGGYDARIHALRAGTGEEAWSVPTGGRVVSSPVSDGEFVYVGSYDHKLYALALADGGERWSRDLGAVVWASPALAEGKVVAAGLDGVVTALDAADGKVLWQQKTGGDIYSSPAIGERKVFVGSKDGNVYAFDLDSGQPLWKIAAPAPVQGSAAYQDGRLVIGADDGSVLGIDVGLGRILWTARTGDAVKSRPAFDGARVWVTGYDKALTALDWKTGEVVARFACDTPVFSSPAVHAGRVYFGGMDGRFFAVDTKPAS